MRSKLFAIEINICSSENQCFSRYWSLCKLCCARVSVCVCESTVTKRMQARAHSVRVRTFVTNSHHGSAEFANTTVGNREPVDSQNGAHL